MVDLSPTCMNKLPLVNDAGINVLGLRINVVEIGEVKRTTT